MASSYGPPHPGYGQPGYAPLDGGYPAPYAPYNGPATAYQPGAPPQGKIRRGKEAEPRRSLTLRRPSARTPRCEIAPRVEAAPSQSRPPSRFSLLVYSFFPATLVFGFFSLSSCISGYSPFPSFLSKAAAATPVSDLSSPLDLGNVLIFSSHPCADTRHSCRHSCPFPNVPSRKTDSVQRQRLSLAADQLPKPL